MNHFKIKEEHKQLAVLVGVGIICVWLGWILAVKPALRNVKTLKADEAVAQERFKIVNEIQNLRIKHKDTAIRSERERHLIMGEITTLANKNGMQVQSVIPSLEESAEAPYSKLLIDMKVQTKFSSLLKFLEAMERYKLNIVLTRIDIRSVSQQGFLGAPITGYLDADLNFKTLLKK